MPTVQPSNPRYCILASVHFLGLKAHGEDCEVEELPGHKDGRHHTPSRPQHERQAKSFDTGGP